MLLAREAADLVEYWQSHALRQSAERMRRAIPVETVGRVFFNVQGRVNAANDTFLRMSRYSRKELEQEEMRWLEMTPPEVCFDLRRCPHRSSATLKRCNPEPSPRTAVSGKATRRTPHTGPDIVKVSTMEEGPDDDVR